MKNKLDGEATCKWDGIESEDEMQEVDESLGATEQGIG
jgi:hypothetical protein